MNASALTAESASTRVRARTYTHSRLCACVTRADRRPRSRSLRRCPTEQARPPLPQQPTWLSAAEKLLYVARRRRRACVHAHARTPPSRADNNNRTVAAQRTRKARACTPRGAQHHHRSTHAAHERAAATTPEHGTRSNAIAHTHKHAHTSRGGACFTNSEDTRHFCRTVPRRVSQPARSLRVSLRDLRRRQPHPAVARPSVFFDSPSSASVLGSRSAEAASSATATAPALGRACLHHAAAMLIPFALRDSAACLQSPA